MLFQLLFHPSVAFKNIAEDDAPFINSTLPYILFILLFPPICSWLGASHFGWRLGGSDPVFFDNTGAIVFSVFYFGLLCVGFVGTALVSRWMAVTYGASTSTALHLSFFAIVCAPLAAASLAHLFPEVMFNVLILLPTLLWSITLLYKGIPITFNIPPERGMLMASALVGWLLVAAVSLLGLSVGLWVNGAGSVLGL